MLDRSWIVVGDVKTEVSSFTRVEPSIISHTATISTVVVPMVDESVVDLLVGLSRGEMVVDERVKASTST